LTAMASAATAPRHLLVLASLAALLLLLFVSTAQGYDGRHPSRRASHRHVLTEKSNATGGPNNKDGSRSSPNATSPPQAAADEHGRRHHPKHQLRNWIIGFAVGSVAGGISGLVVSVLFRLVVNCVRGRNRRRSGTVIFTPKLIKRADQLAFLEKEDGLASLPVIGCGEVYKAQLSPAEGEDEQQPPRFIAIKKIRKQQPHAGDNNNLSDEESRLLDRWSRQIQSEIRTVGYIRHRNLLSLAAHVPRPDCHYLVYEYMKNGSLHHALKATTGDGVEQQPLPWPARLRVAVGVAAGLEYLHVSQNPPIIHRDLKPANVLLDDDMEPRIADFGLAKAMPDAHTHVTASAVAGTLGYIAPEYHQTSKFTAKCDVYSFGVILAVLGTGKEPTDAFFAQVHNDGLVKWLRRLMHDGNHAEAIDPAIACPQYQDQIVLLLRIAVFCTDEDHKKRPTAKEIRCMLAEIKSARDLL
jgi:serine/threonine protein kinase